MSYTITFYRESNNFNDITDDPALKNAKISHVLKFHNHLLLCIPGSDDVVSYLTLKHGDDIIDNDTLFQDFSPVMYKDYWPVKPRC